MLVSSNDIFLKKISLTTIDLGFGSLFIQETKWLLNLPKSHLVSFTFQIHYY